MCIAGTSFRCFVLLYKTLRQAVNRKVSAEMVICCLRSKRNPACPARAQEGRQPVVFHPLIFTPFPSEGLAQIRKQGKGRSSKRKENRRLSFLFAPAAGAAVSRAPQSATPPLNLSEKHPARQGRTCLRQFVFPAQPVLKKGCRPPGANTPAAVRVPQLVGAGNIYKKELLRNATALSSVNLNRTGSKPKFPRRYARSPR